MYVRHYGGYRKLGSLSTNLVTDNLIKSNKPAVVRIVSQEPVRSTYVDHHYLHIKLHGRKIFDMKSNNLEIKEAKLLIREIREKMSIKI